MKTLCVLFFLIVMAGCSLPVTTVRSVDTRPSISLTGANKQAELYVDGIKMGRAVDFEEPNQLRLEPGAHQVSIVEMGKSTFEQKIFIESEHKTIFAR